MKRVLVTASKSWADTGAIRATLEAYHRAHRREHTMDMIVVEERAAGKVAANIARELGWRVLSVEQLTSGPADLASVSDLIGPGVDACFAYLRGNSGLAEEIAGEAELAGIETYRIVHEVS